MGRMSDLLGTLIDSFQIGKGGPRIKRNGNNIDLRNAADNAYIDLIVAALQAANINVTGNDITLNSDAAGSGADRTMTLSRPSTGMANNLTIVLPAGNPSPGQALTVASFAGNVVTLEYSTVAGGSDKAVWDTTPLAFGDTSPKAMFNLPANAVVLAVKVIIDTSFNGTPTLSIGISGTTSKYMGTGHIDLTAAAGTVFEVDPALASVGSVEALIASYAAGGASAGAARILVGYVIPS